MDLNIILYLVVFILLILIVSRFMEGNGTSTSFGEKNRPYTSKHTIKKHKAEIKTSKIDSDFKTIIDFLENEVFLRYGKNKNEKDYQDDLFQAFGVLRERHGYEIKYESKNGRHRIDFSVNGTIGIELKVHRGGAQVKKELFNQITDYASYYPKMIGVVVNVNDKDTPSEIRSDIYCKLKQQNVISESNYYIVLLSTTSR